VKDVLSFMHSVAERPLDREAGTGRSRGRLGPTTRTQPVVLYGFRQKRTPHLVVRGVVRGVASDRRQPCGPRFGTMPSGRHRLQWVVLV